MRLLQTLFYVTLVAANPNPNDPCGLYEPNGKRIFEDSNDFYKCFVKHIGDWKQEQAKKLEDVVKEGGNEIAFQKKMKDTLLMKYKIVMQKFWFYDVRDNYFGFRGSFRRLFFSLHFAKKFRKKSQIF